MVSQPMVSVILPVYNAEPYLSNAIESILNQTYTDFEFLIINDGSTDRSEEIILSYKDSRIKYLINPGNQGLIKSLNKAIDYAQGRYLARMDADDISLSTRFEKQISFLESNPEIGVCGSFLQTFDKQRRVLRTEVRHEDIVAKMFIDCSIWHPTVMMRKKIFVDHDVRYDGNYYRCEDYKLWTDLEKLTRFHNLPEVLYLYRFHDEQESQKENNVNEIRTFLTCELLGREISDEEIFLNKCLHYLHPFSDVKILYEVRKWVSYLKETNREKGRYDVEVFNKWLDEKMRTLHQKVFLSPIRSKKKTLLNTSVFTIFSRRHSFRDFSLADRGKILIKWFLLVIGFKGV